MSLDETMILQHRVLKMQVRVPKDKVQKHLSMGKVVLYTVSFSPAEWEEISHEDTGSINTASERF